MIKQAKTLLKIISVSIAIIFTATIASDQQFSPVTSALRPISAAGCLDITSAFVKAFPADMDPVQTARAERLMRVKKVLQVTGRWPAPIKQPPALETNITTTTFPDGVKRDWIGPDRQWHTVTILENTKIYQSLAAAALRPSATAKLRDFIIEVEAALAAVNFSSEEALGLMVLRTGLQTLLEHKTAAGVKAFPEEQKMVPSAEEEEAVRRLKELFIELHRIFVERSIMEESRSASRELGMAAWHIDGLLQDINSDLKGKGHVRTWTLERRCKIMLPLMLNMGVEQTKINSAIGLANRILEARKSMPASSLSRREFLKEAGTGVAAVVTTTNLFPKKRADAASTDKEKAEHFLRDILPQYAKIFLENPDDNKKIKGAIKDLRSHAEELDSDISLKIADILDEYFNLLNAENRESAAQIYERIKEADSAINKTLSGFDLYVMISLAGQQGTAKKPSIYVKSFKLEEPQAQLKNMAGGNRIFLATGIDDIPLCDTKALYYNDCIYIFMDLINKSAQQVFSSLKTPKPAKDALDASMQELLKRDFAGLDITAIAAKILKVTIMHEAGHAPDKGNLNENKAIQEAHSFLSELASGIAPYYTLHEWAGFLQDGDEISYETPHALGAMSIFNALIKNLNENNPKKSLQLGSFPTREDLNKAITLLMKLSRENLIDLAKNTEKGYQEGVKAFPEASILDHPLGLQLRAKYPSFDSVFLHIEPDHTTDASTATTINPVLRSPGGSPMTIRKAVVAQTTEVLQDALDRLVETDGLPETLEMKVDISRLGKFRVRMFDGQLRGNDGKPATYRAMGVNLNNLGAFEIELSRQLLDGPLEKEEQTNEVRALLLRNALDHMTQGIDSEQILFRDVVYVSMLSEEQWKDLKTGLMSLAVRSSGGEFLYLKLLDAGRRFMKSMAEQDMEALTIHTLPQGLRSVIRKLAACYDGFKSIGKSSICNLIDRQLQNPGYDAKKHTLYAFSIRSSEQGMISIGRSRVNKDHAFVLDFLKSNTLYSVKPVFDEFASTWVLQLFEINENDYLPTSCIPDKYYIIDSAKQRGVRSYSPGELIVNYINAKINNQQCPQIPANIYLKRAKDQSGTCISFGYYKKEGEAENTSVQLRSGRFNGIGAFRLEFNSEDPYYGLTVKAYEIDDKTGQDLSSLPVVCSYYDFKKRDFVSFESGGYKENFVVSDGKSRAICAMFGIQNPEGVFAEEPVSFISRCYFKDQITLRSNLYSLLEEAGALRGIPQKVLKKLHKKLCFKSLMLTSELFKTGSTYEIKVFYDEECGWLVNVYELNQGTLRRVNNIPLVSFRLVAKINHRRAAGPLISRGWVETVKGRVALSMLKGGIDLKELVNKGYNIGFEKFIPGKRAFMELMCGKQASPRPWTERIMSKDGIVRLSLDFERIGDFVTHLSEGDHCRFEPVYSDAMGCWVIFGFKYSDENEEFGLYEEDIANVWHITKDRKIRSTELDKSEKKKLIAQINKRFRASHGETLSDVLYEARLINDKTAITKKANLGYATEKNSILKQMIKHFLYVTLPLVKEVLAEQHTAAAGYGKVPLGYTDQRMFQASAVLQWTALKAAVGKNSPMYESNAFLLIKNLVKPTMDKVDVRIDEKLLKDLTQHYIKSVLKQGNLYQNRHFLFLLSEALDRLSRVLGNKQADTYLTEQILYLESIKCSTADSKLLQKILVDLFTASLFEARYPDTAKREEEQEGEPRDDIDWFADTEEDGVSEEEMREQLRNREITRLASNAVASERTDELPPEQPKKAVKTLSAASRRILQSIIINHIVSSGGNVGFDEIRKIIDAGIPDAVLQEVIDSITLKMVFVDVFSRPVSDEKPTQGVDQAA